MRNKRAPIPFNLDRLADTDSVVYVNDTDLGDVSSSKGANIAARRISQKYKKMRNKKQPLPFSLSDIADADTVDYNDDINLEDANMKKNTILAAKKSVTNIEIYKGKEKELKAQSHYRTS